MTTAALGDVRRLIVMPRLNRLDSWLVLASVALAALGVVMVFNSSYFYAQERYGDPFLFFRKHMLALGGGVAVMMAVSRIQLQWFERLAYPLLLCTLILLVMVLIPGIGVSRGGARRWISLGVINFQPTELAKIAVVLYLARSMSRKSDRMQRFGAAIVPHVAVVGAGVLLIAAQPDFGTAAILMLVLVLMLFGGGARPAHLVGMVLAVLPFALYELVHASYRWRRILAFLDPWRYSQDIAFQLVQSLIAFGSGGVTGVGLGESRQKMFFLPEAHTDFIFALIGEELGLIGALSVLILFAVIGMRGFRIAARHPDPFASLLAFGLTLVILVEAVVNVGVVVGLLPTKGLPLPFLSYGGSALVGTFVQVGILAGLSRMTG